MTETEILKLRKPAGSDYFSVEDLNYNAEMLETIAAERITTVLVIGDVGTNATVNHSSGTYTKTITEHAEQPYNYADFTLPFGGHTEITHIVNGNKHSQEHLLVNGATEWIISHKMTAYQSYLASVPDGYFAENANFPYVKNNTLYPLKKMTLEELRALESEIDYAEDYKNHLWHATRTGMITADEYATATGETYTSTPPVRVTQY